MGSYTYILKLFEEVLSRSCLKIPGGIAEDSGQKFEIFHEKKRVKFAVVFPEQGWVTKRRIQKR